MATEKRTTRWRFLPLAIALLIVLGTVPGLPVRVHAAGLLYVAPDGNDSNDCLTPTTACKTIGAAVGKASAGDTLNVAAGTYAETLNLNSDLDIRGAGADVTTIDAGGAGGVVTIFGMRRVHLANLTISRGQSV